MYSKDIYASWRSKQAEKYSQLMPLMKEHFRSSFSVIDVGVGPAWIHGALKDEGIVFKRTVGVDAEAQMTEPRRESIEYRIVPEFFETEEKFDLVICFDTAHLISNPERLLEYAKTGGLLLISVPLRFKSILNRFKENNKCIIIEGGEIGEEETDAFLLAQVK